MDIQQNNVAVLHFNLVNQDGSTIFIRKTKLATFNLINPSAVSVPITDIGFDATLNQCWVRVPKASNAATGQYYGVLNIVDDDWGTYTTSKIKVYSVVSDADSDTKSVVFTATCIATQVTNPSGGNSPYYNTTTSTWWQYSDTLKAFEDTGVGNIIHYITKNVQHLKDGTGNGSIVTCLDDEISANNTATGLCSTDFGKDNVKRGESCVALGENNYIADGVSNATAISGAEPSAIDVFAIGDKTAGHKNVFTINKFGDIYFRPDSSQERTTILQDILNSVIKNVVYDSSKFSLTVTFYSAADNANKTKTYDLSGLKAVLKDDAVKEISVNQATAVMTVDTINGSSQQIQLPSYLFYNGNGSEKYNQQSGSEVEIVGHRTTGNGIIFGDYNPNASEPQLASGNNSMAFGCENQATADYAVGIGNANTVSGMYAFGVGCLNTVAALGAYAIGQSNNVGTSASRSMVMGCNNAANNIYSTIFGNGCESNGDYSTLVGCGLNSDANYQFVIGKYNDNSNEHIFEIGFGKSDSQRSNLLYVDYNGNLNCSKVTASAFSGNASSATNLATARNIGLSGVTATAQSFDGTADITIPITEVPATLLTGTASISTTGNAATATKAIQDGNGHVITSTYFPSGGGTLTGNITLSGSGTGKGIYGKPSGTDAWRLVGGATANDSGWVELATADDGIKPIYVRQYQSSQYGPYYNALRTATLLDASGNTSFPGTVTASGDIYYKKSVSTADISSGVLSISSLTKFINISTGNGTITSINNTATGYNVGDEIILYGTFTFNVDGSSFKVTDGALKIIYTGTKFVRLY